MIFISRRKLSRLNVFQKPKIKEQIQMEKCRYSRSSKTPNKQTHQTAKRHKLAHKYAITQTCKHAKHVRPFGGKNVRYISKNNSQMQKQP